MLPALGDLLLLLSSAGAGLISSKESLLDDRRSAFVGTRFECQSPKPTKNKHKSS
jgi:hypothetical protein